MDDDILSTYANSSKTSHKVSVASHLKKGLVGYMDISSLKLAASIGLVCHRTKQIYSQLMKIPMIETVLYCGKLAQ